jgi:hypothetical protein
VHAANDSKDLAVQVNEATNASSTTGKGGRFEWLGLALLALPVARCAYGDIPHS